MPIKSTPIRGFGGSSMVPDFSPPRQEAAPQEPVPDLRELGLEASDQRALARLIQESAAFGEAEREAKKARKPVTEAIKAILAKYDIDQVGKFLCDDIPVVYFDTERKSLSRELLLSRGVRPDILTACTTVTHSRTLRVGGEFYNGE